MGDVDEVVDLCAAANAGFGEGATVDGCVGTDFYIVFDGEGALLREEEIFSVGGVACVAKAGGAENRAGLYD